MPLLRVRSCRRPNCPGVVYIFDAQCIASGVGMARRPVRTDAEQISAYAASLSSWFTPHSAMLQAMQILLLRPTAAAAGASGGGAGCWWDWLRRRWLSLRLSC